MKGMEAEYGNSVLSAQFYYEPETILKKKKKENLLMKERKKNPKPKKSVYRTVKKKHSFNILISVHTENKKYLLKYCTKRPVEGI